MTSVQRRLLTLVSTVVTVGSGLSAVLAGPAGAGTPSPTMVAFAFPSNMALGGGFLNDRAAMSGLACSGNVPPPDNAGQPNIAGSSTGQCAGVARRARGSSRDLSRA